MPSKPGEAPRHGKAYRELFQLVRSTNLNDPKDNQESDDHARSSRPDI